jgi:hypothetical protein
MQALNHGICGKTLTQTDWTIPIRSVKSHTRCKVFGFSKQVFEDKIRAPREHVIRYSIAVIRYLGKIPKTTTILPQRSVPKTSSALMPQSALLGAHFLDNMKYRRVCSKSLSHYMFKEKASDDIVKPGARSNSCIYHAITCHILNTLMTLFYTLNFLSLDFQMPQIPPHRDHYRSLSGPLSLIQICMRDGDRIT